MRDRHPRFFDALIWPAVVLGDALILLCFVAAQFLVVQVLGGAREDAHKDLALTGGAFGAVYVVVVHFGAWLGTRVGFRRTAIVGGILTLTAPLVLSQAGGIWSVAAGTGIIGLGGGLLWPNLEAELARGRQGLGLRKRLSFFNTMWCFGTLLGPLMSWLLYPSENVVESAAGRGAVNVAFYGSAAMGVLMVALLALWKTRLPGAVVCRPGKGQRGAMPCREEGAMPLPVFGEGHVPDVGHALPQTARKGMAPQGTSAEMAPQGTSADLGALDAAAPLDAAPLDAAADPVKLRAFLLMSYVANLLCYVVLGVLRQLYEALADFQWHGRGAAQIHSLLLVLLAGASCATFATLYFAHRWPYRIRRFVLYQFILLAGLLLIAVTSFIPAVAAGFVLVGVATSFFYSGSLFYSIEGRSESKHMAGWHEMIVGLGNLGGLLLAGNVPWMLQKMGLACEEWLIRSPYLVVAGLFAAACAVQLAIYAWHKPRFAAAIAQGEAAR